MPDWEFSDVRLVPDAGPLFPLLFDDPRDEVSPGTTSAVLVSGSPIAVERLRWGFSPPWAREDSKRQINGRSETIFTSPFFRDAVRRGRCVVPTTGYYEWTGTARHKRRQLVARRDGDVVWLAGVCTHGTADDEGTFAILTCEPNRVVRTIHDRMPVVLPDEDSIARWLEPRELAKSEVDDLFVPCADELLEVRQAPDAKANRQLSFF